MCSAPSRARPRRSCNRSRRRFGASPPAATRPAPCAGRTSSPSGLRLCPIRTAVAPVRKGATGLRVVMPAAESQRPSGVITITTDFGHQGPFVGVIKGCMLARFPEARLVDLTHEIVVHWPAEAGFWLARAFGYFPAGTVHVAVVDPGVGTSRNILAVRAQNHVFLAPDNGLLAPVVARHPDAEVIRLEGSQLARFGLHRPSATFHGRDIFAPIAAEIAAGRCVPADLGPSLTARSPAGSIVP